MPSASSFKLNEIKEKIKDLQINIEEIKSIDTIENKYQNFNFKKNIPKIISKFLV